MDADSLLRGLLAAEAFVAVLLAGQWLGSAWHDRGWPTRIILSGGIGILVYVLLGQVKAFNLDIPFDWFSVIGLGAYTVFLVGLIWHTRERLLRRGR